MSMGVKQMLESIKQRVLEANLALAQLESTLLEYSPLVRNRLTLMRLRSCF